MLPDREDRVVCHDCLTVFDYTKDRHKLFRVSTGTGEKNKCSGYWTCIDCRPWAVHKGKERVNMNARINYNKNTHTASIYFILAEEVGRVKIGITTNIRARMYDLQNSSPVELKLIALFENKTFEDERFLHAVFSDYRIRGEWFRYSDEIKDFLGNSVDKVEATTYSPSK